MNQHPVTKKWLDPHLQEVRPEPHSPKAHAKKVSHRSTARYYAPVFLVLFVAAVAFLTLVAPEHWQLSPDPLISNVRTYSLCLTQCDARPNDHVGSPIDAIPTRRNDSQTHPIIVEGSHRIQYVLSGGSPLSYFSPSGANTMAAKNCVRQFVGCTSSIEVLRQRLSGIHPERSSTI
jgi:hypothetical protein